MGFFRVFLTIVIVSCYSFAELNLKNIKIQIDNTIYKVSMDNMANPNSFQVRDKNNKPVNLSQNDLAKLYNATEMLAVMNNKIEVDTNVLENIIQAEKAMGMIDDNKHKSAIIGTVVGTFIPVSGAVAVASNVVGVAGAILTTNDYVMEASQKDRLFGLAHGMYEVSKNINKKAEKERLALEKKINAGKTININELSKIFTTKMLATKYGDVAIEASRLADKSGIKKRTSVLDGDNLKNMVVNGVPFGSIVSSLLNADDIVKTEEAIKNFKKIERKVRNDAKNDVYNTYNSKQALISTKKYLQKQGIFKKNAEEYNKFLQNENRLAKEKQQKEQAKKKYDKIAQDGVDKANKLVSIKQAQREKVKLELSKNSNTKKGARKAVNYWKKQKIALLKESDKLYKIFYKKIEILVEAEKMAKKYPNSSFRQRNLAEAQRYYNEYKALVSENDRAFSEAKKELKKAEKKYLSIKRIEKKLRKKEQKIIAETKEAKKKVEEAKLTYNNLQNFIFTDIYTPKSADTLVHRVENINLPIKQNDSIRENTFVGNTNNPIQNPVSSPLLIAGSFRATPMMYHSEMFRNISDIVKATFGDNYNVADWNDIKLSYNTDSDLLKTGLGYIGTPSPTTYNYTLTNNGSFTAARITSSGVTFDRQYYMSYHNHNKPGYYLAHDNLNNYDISLGSWSVQSYIMAKKIDSSITDRPTSGYGYTGSTTQSFTWYGGVSIMEQDGTMSLGNLEGTSNPLANSITSVVSGTFGLNGVIRDSYYEDKNNFGVIIDHNDGSNKNSYAISSPDEEITQYQYMTWGAWKEQEYGKILTETVRGSSFLIGQMTAGGNMPVAGSATYNGKVSGAVYSGGSTTTVNGNLNLQANFGTRQLTGGFSGMKLENGNNWHDMNVNASWNPNSSQILGTLGGNGMTGNVEGRFFGPNAEELGGGWSATGNGDKGTGIFRGKK